MDDRLRVCFPVTPNSSKSCTLTCSIFSYKTLTCLLNNKYYLFVMKNKVPCCLINVMLYTTTKTVHMEIVMCLYTLYNYSNKKLLIYYFHQETNSIVHLVEIVMFNIFLTSFAVYVKKAEI